jgi:spermidine synthase
MKVEQLPKRAGSVSGKRTALRLAILSGVLFFSGIAALIFETLWLRLSGLAFGNSVWSAALILSSFMVGLALGNALAASSKVRRWRPLHLYALLELAVAIFGCTIVFGLPLLGELLRPLWQTLWTYQPALISLRFAVSFVILLVPTTAMGLTLPVLIEDPVLQRTNFGGAIGLLYGFNTLGAVVGAVVGEAFLIAVFGVHGTAITAAGASVAAAIVALLIASKSRGTVDLATGRGAPLRMALNYRPPWRLLLVSFGSGCILLSLEVIWFRFLRLYVASSSTAFAVMLAVALAGIALGSILSGAIQRRRLGAVNTLPIFLLLAAIATLLSYLFFPGEAVKTAAGAFDLAAWPQVALLSVALMFPVAFLSGVLFPAVAARVQMTVEDRMNSTGIVTLFNTTGAAAGPLLASFVILPGIGFEWGLVLCAVSYAVLAVLASDRSIFSVWPIGLSVAALSIGLIAIPVMFPFHRAEKHFAHAALPYETDDHGQLFAQLTKRVEGAADTYQLVRRDLFGRPYYYRLLTNGFSMSATNPRSQRYMRLFAYLPLAFRPETEDVLLICYGCGVTADAFLHGPRVKHMDVVDISKEVLALADSYVGINYSNPLRDPRVSAYVQDGRFFLQASPRQYDVISGEPPPPKVAGAVNLYTEEFFALMNSRLKEGGIATFWLPINQLKIDEAKAILRGFQNAFPNASLWASADQEWIMMGIKGAVRNVSEEEINRLWRDPVTAEDLRRIGIEVPQQLGALFVMDRDEIERITNGVAPLSDLYPKRLTDARWSEQASHEFAAKYMEAASAYHRFLWSPTFAKIWPETLNRSLESFFIVREARYLSATIGSNKLAELDLYLRHSQLRTPVLEIFGSEEIRLALAEEDARKSNSPPAETLPDLTAGALARRDIGGAIRLIEQQRAQGVNGLDDMFLLIYLYCLHGSVNKAEELAAANTASIQKDWFVDWLWRKLETDFGFRPPA